MLLGDKDETYVTAPMSPSLWLDSSSSCILNLCAGTCSNRCIIRFIFSGLLWLPLLLSFNNKWSCYILHFVSTTFSLYSSHFSHVHGAIVFLIIIFTSPQINVDSSSPKNSNYPRYLQWQVVSFKSVTHSYHLYMH